LFDISHPDAFKNSGKFHTALLDEADFAMNRAAFAENGYSKGVFYNMYCNARTTLSDGRVYVFGGHDMQSDNGLYKVNIFDPDTETWVKRREPCTRANWNKDPRGLALFARDPNAQFYDNCDPRDQQSTQPSEPSDQKYGRWYPSAVALPNDTVLVVGGFDQDNSVGPDPARAAKGRQNISQTDTAFTASRVNQVVPEVYDPKTDRNTALENARMAFPLYPQLEVVQTGPGRDDWKVCTFNGEIEYGPEAIPGGAKFGVGGGAPDFKNGTTWCLDVLPDGKVLLGQGLNRGLASVGDRLLDFERREGLRFHMYDPATGAVTPLARTTVSRGLHGTATLLPDGTVFFAGENREALVQA